MKMKWKKGEWKPFYFESDVIHGWVRYPEHFEEIRKVHSIEELNRAKSWDKTIDRFMIRPFFGFTDQCRNGKKTLREHFEYYGMMGWWK